MIHELYKKIQVIKEIPLSEKIEDIFKQYDLIMPKKRKEEEPLSRNERRKNKREKEKNEKRNYKRK